jgi:hypothetical protein
MGVVTASFEVLSWNLPAGTKETYKILQAGKPV